MITLDNTGHVTLQVIHFLPQTKLNTNIVVASSQRMEDIRFISSCKGLESNGPSGIWKHHTLDREWHGKEAPWRTKQRSSQYPLHVPTSHPPPSATESESSILLDTLAALAINAQQHAATNKANKTVTVRQMRRTILGCCYNKQPVNATST